MEEYPYRALECTHLGKTQSSEETLMQSASF
jgi:hypothetical protein